MNINEIGQYGLDLGGKCPWEALRLSASCILMSWSLSQTPTDSRVFLLDIMCHDLYKYSSASLSETSLFVLS